MDVVQYAIYGIGALAFMPIIATAISAANRARRERRRRAMFDRFNSRIGGY